MSAFLRVARAGSTRDSGSGHAGATSPTAYTETLSALIFHLLLHWWNGVRKGEPPMIFPSAIPVTSIVSASAQEISPEQFLLLLFIRLGKTPSRIYLLRIFLKIGKMIPVDHR